VRVWRSVSTGRSLPAPAPTAGPLRVLVAVGAPIPRRPPRR
jgi:hypothetical protein